MVRRVGLLCVAFACAVSGVVALPAAGAHADVFPPRAEILSDPPASADGVVTCQRGASYVTLTAINLDNPPGGGQSYQWNSPVGPGGGTNSKTFGFECDFDGSIEVSVTLTDIMGNADIATVAVVANEAPVAVISVGGEPVGDYVDAEVGSSVTLSAAASYDPEGGPLQSEWYSPSGLFGGSPGEGLITVDCDQGKLFNVGLTVTDDAGAEGTAGTTVNCFDRATASFTPEPAVPGKRTFVAIGTKITFKPANPAYASDWQWRTTGVRGVASTDYQYIRTFNKLGDYGVQLTESNDNGRATKWVGYTVIGPPVASVTANPGQAADRITVTTGTRVAFDGSGSRSPGGGSLMYQWRTTGEPGVVTDSSSYARRFDTPGNFGVELTVTNVLGQRAKRWVGITVVRAEAPIVSVTPAPAKPPVRTRVRLGSTIDFNGRASTDPDGGTLTYQWRTTGVGGVAATTDTYSRRFNQLGDVGVELTVIDDEGQRSKLWLGFTVVR